MGNIFQYFLPYIENWIDGSIFFSVVLDLCYIAVDLELDDMDVFYRFSILDSVTQ